MTDLGVVVGQAFSADVLRRSQQKLLVVLEKLSSFISATIIPSEKSTDLKNGLVQLTSPLISPGGCSVKVDNATGFRSLQEDRYLKEIGISIYLSRVKNKNSNPTVVTGGNQTLVARWTTSFTKRFSNSCSKHQQPYSIVWT